MWSTRTATKSTTVERRSKAAVCTTSIRTAGPRRFIRNEHIGWSQGTPPPGIYEVRVDYWENCDAPETNYIVNVYNRGHVSTFSGTFTGPGDEGGRGSGRVITQFEIPGGKPRPPVVTEITSTYRGSGDQVFVLNPDAEVLDDTLYTLHLGSASAEVYLIATNTAPLPHGAPHRAARSFGGRGQGTAGSPHGASAAVAAADDCGDRPPPVGHGVQQQPAVGRRAGGRPEAGLSSKSRGNR